MGTGEAEGEDRAQKAADMAISNPLLDDVSMKGARGVLINITGGPDLMLFEVEQAANRIRAEVDPDANIIFGNTILDNMEGRIRVSVVATGIEAADQRLPRNVEPFRLKPVPRPMEMPMTAPLSGNPVHRQVRGNRRRLGRDSRNFAGGSHDPRRQTKPRRSSPCRRKLSPSRSRSVRCARSRRVRPRRSAAALGACSAARSVRKNRASSPRPRRVSPQRVPPPRRTRSRNPNRRASRLNRRR